MFKNLLAVTLIAIAVVVATDCFPGLLQQLVETCRIDAVRSLIG